VLRHHPDAQEKILVMIFRSVELHPARHRAAATCTPLTCAQRGLTAAVRARLRRRAGCGPPPVRPTHSCGGAGPPASADTPRVRRRPAPSRPCTRPPATAGGNQLECGPASRPTPAAAGGTPRLRPLVHAGELPQQSLYVARGDGCGNEIDLRPCVRLHLRRRGTPGVCGRNHHVPALHGADLGWDAVSRATVAAARSTAASASRRTPVAAVLPGHAARPVCVG